MCFRWEIRARWWAYRLTRVESREERSYYLTCLAAIGDKSLGAVDRLLRDPRPEVRRMAVTVLERCPAEKADERLARLLSDTNEDVAVEAALVLASRGNTAVLMETLRDHFRQHGGPARHAAVALQRIGGPQAEQLLIEALPQTSDPDLRAQIIDSLGMLGCTRAVPLLTDMLADERPVSTLPYSQRSALEAVAAAQDQWLSRGFDLEAVRSALQGEQTVASIAARSLRLITGKPFGNPTTQPATRRTSEYR